MRGLAGKTVVVCGGATGIGAASAERLASEGAAVVVGDVAFQAARQTAARIGEQGGRALAVHFDLADDQSVEALMERAVGEFGRVHCLLNVGADLSPQTVGRDGDLLEMDLAVWRRTFEVNLLGYARTCRAAIQRFVPQGGGAIVNISSTAAGLGEPTRPAYAASKAGINALTRHIASRWGKEGVRCNAIAPGLVLTQIARVALDEQFKSGVLAQLRTSRLGDPADIANIVAFLLSDEAAWVNGQVWTVDGGQSLHD